MKLFLVFTFSLLLFSSANAQFTEYHPELEWYTLTGKYSEVHYHSGAERTAKVVAKILDEIWEPITSLYNYEPELVHFVIKDIDDYSNGATYFFDNKIEIWTSALDFDLRGTHNWLRNVISHEFTHLVQIQASMKASRSIPAVFLQVLNYEDERRPDILYGFPNFIVSYPLASINVPAWFAEGTAQYMRKEFDYDNWDSHRDMILRSYALDSNMLTWNQMGVFGKTSLGNESVYNSGFALTRYIAQKYGEDKLRKVSESLGDFFNFTIDAAFEDILGKNGQQLYDEWKTFLMEDYRNRTADVLKNATAGEMIASEGFGNFYPLYSEDGKKFLYISNKSSDYFGPAGVYLRDLETGKEEQLVSGVRSTLGWINGSDKIVYAKIDDDNPNWYNVHDLYTYDIKTEDETRLTHGLRANQPAVSNDGKDIVFLFQKDGTTNLGVVNIDGKNFRQLTFFSEGEQVYNPVFSPDDAYIYFDYSVHHGRDISRIVRNGGSIEQVLSTKSDERNPSFTPDGQLLFASDVTGIFNIYKLDTTGLTKTQLTNVTGGAFMPASNKDGQILYAGYTSRGYKIFKLEPAISKNIIAGMDYERTGNPPLDKEIPNGDISNYDVAALMNFKDSDTPEYENKKYSGAFSKLTIFPYVRYDNYNTTSKFGEKIKPGLYVSSSDMLNRYSLFAGGSINTRLERDLFLIFDYRNKLPLLFNIGLKPEMSLELYNISRKADVDLFFGSDTVGNTVNYDYIVPTDVTYNLTELDLVARHRIFSRAQNLELRFIYSRYTAILGSFILPDENSTLYPTTYDTYLIGKNFQLKYTFDAILPDVDSDINPTGQRIEFTYNYEMNQFNEEGEYSIDDGILVPQYKDINFHRLELASRTHLGLWSDHTLSAQIRAGTILGAPVSDFFDFYLGGLVGMKAYPFYALSGNEIAWLNMTYRIPLFRNIDTKIGHLYLDKIFFSVYGDVGNAWTGDIPSISSLKRGAGAEIRVQLNSFYLFPTSIFVNGSYGFDKVTRIVNNEVITYGKEVRFYGGILFGFDF